MSSVMWLSIPHTLFLPLLFHHRCKTFRSILLPTYYSCCNYCSLLAFSYIYLYAASTTNLAGKQLLRTHYCACANWTNVQWVFIRSQHFTQHSDFTEHFQRILIFAIHRSTTQNITKQGVQTLSTFHYTKCLAMYCEMLRAFEQGLNVIHDLIH